MEHDEPEDYGLQYESPIEKACPECDQTMSDREKQEQGICDDCYGGRIYR